MQQHKYEDYHAFPPTFLYVVWSICLFKVFALVAYMFGAGPIQWMVG